MTSSPPPSSRLPGLAPMHPAPGGQQPIPGQSAETPTFRRPEDFPTLIGNDGRTAWAFGLLGLIPLLGSLIMGVVMLCVGLAQRRRNPVAARVGRRAAIFGGITLAIIVVYFALVGIGALTISPNATYDSPPPLMIVAIACGVWTIFLGPLVGVIMGIVALARPVSREKAARILGQTHSVS